MTFTTAVVLLACIAGALAFPGGAPASVCDTLMPGHGPAGQPPPSPYYLDLSAFEVTNTAMDNTTMANNTNFTTEPPIATGLYYVPGYTYTIILKAMPNVTFRGFLIQGRSYPEGVTFVGTFQDPIGSPYARLSSCTPPTAGVTHVQPQNRDERLDFTYMMFNWTAPDAWTGPVQFFFTTVQEFNTFWVAQQSAVIQEQGNPFVPAPIPTGVPTPTGAPIPTGAPPPMGTPIPSPDGTPVVIPPMDGGAPTVSGLGFWAILATALCAALKALN